MRARIVILPDGGLTLITDEGTFTEGATRITQLLGALSRQGVEFETVNPPEQHRHDEEHLHTHAHAEAGHDH